MRDFYSNHAVRSALLPASYAATTNGIPVDLRDIKSTTVHISVGATLGAAAFSAKLQESADAVTWNDVPAALQQSDAPGVLVQNFSYRLGYIGSKRYIRPVLTLASGTSATLSALAVVEPLTRPVP